MGGETSGDRAGGGDLGGRGCTLGRVLLSGSPGLARARLRRATPAIPSEIPAHVSMFCEALTKESSN